MGAEGPATGPRGGRRPVVQLPAKVANQIAAGEVVARPASVVKELLENALDAGASRVRVDIDGGGAERIAIVDDGHGMNERDAQLALRRHATSKIREVHDLTQIDTFGFRGEALPSIASVSRLTLRTREAQADEGLEVTVEGGEEPTLRPCGCAPGTAIEVRDLFFNVPARRKFLRAASTEAAHVTEAVRDVALARPGLHLELIRDGRPSKRWLANPSAADRVAEVLGLGDLTLCEGERGPVSVVGYLSAPSKARNGAGGLHLFVCGRPVRDRALARAVAAAYGDRLERGRYPVGAVFLDMPLDLVDVNVHPQKAEVRFAHARAVTDTVYRIVADAMAPTSVPAPRGAMSPGARPAPAQEEADPWTWSGAATPEPSPASHRPEPLTPRPQPALSAREPLAHRDGLHPWRFVGLAGEGLAIFEDREELAIVSTSRAKSAWLAQEARRVLAAGSLVAQRLLFPVRLPSPLARRAAELAIAAKRHGFDLRAISDDSVSVHAVPRLFAAAAPETVSEALLAALTNDDLDGLPERLVALAITADPTLDDHLVHQLERRPELVDASALRRLPFDQLER